MPRTANQQPNPESKRQRRKQRAIQKRRMQMEKIEQNENNQQNVQSENQQWNSNNTKKGKEQKNKKENKNDEGQEHQPNSQPWPDERHPGGGITGQWHGQHHSHANDCNEEPNPWLKEDRYKRASPEHEASDQGWGDEPNLRPKKNRNKRANSLNASSRRVGWESPWDRSSPAPSLAESSGLLWGKGSNCDKSPDQAGRAQSDAGSTYGLAAMGAWDDGEDKQHGWGSSSRDPDEKWYEPKWKENAKWETDGSLRQQVAEAMGTSRARENHGSPERGYRGRSPAYRTSPVGRGDYDTGWGDNNDTARKEDPQWW
ncbi:uncharacterized protein N7515_005956 [Penicillium bovifimosum]|uniref:Uncharacterized protein n=1 Tax=Penicillium bovifimosum TaxID=126998 RepID=A0A9W9L0Q7_9EURO|nr:uncharacterized protein N7515_005956 [Penicillium bovifimosum]KAJ5129917.1 hypothetical protein N7515_005956 [Penicillium bovifimosum]